MAKLISNLESQLLNKTMILTDQLFNEFIEAAALAPSADNMQPWEFRKNENRIEVFIAKSRILPTDVMAMFAWIAVGAAIQNIVVAASCKGLLANVEYNSAEKVFELAANIRFTKGDVNNIEEGSIEKRTTNRCPFALEPLSHNLIDKLTRSINTFKANVHFTTNHEQFSQLAQMDARSSYIRLSHKPLHDELFDILRFTRKEFEEIRFGLTFESLEVPVFAVTFARQLKFWAVARLVSLLRFDRLVARQLSVKLKKAGAIGLVCATEQKAVGYMEAGRAMEQLWLIAAQEGLSVQPYGVLPQYLTKVKVEPETFLPKHVQKIERLREPFYGVFPGARNEYPALVLRLGYSKELSARSEIRLKMEDILKH